MIFGLLSRWVHPAFCNPQLEPCFLAARWMEVKTQRLNQWPVFMYTMKLYIPVMPPMPATSYDLPPSVPSGRLYHHYGPPMCYLPWRAKGQEKPSVNLQPMSSIYLGGNSKYIRKQLLLSAKYLWYTSSPTHELASAPALCTKCRWSVRRNEAIQVPARLLYWSLP